MDKLSPPWFWRHRLQEVYRVLISTLQFLQLAPPTQNPLNSGAVYRRAGCVITKPSLTFYLSSALPVCLWGLTHSTRIVFVIPKIQRRLYSGFSCVGLDVSCFNSSLEAQTSFCASAKLPKLLKHMPILKSLFSSLVPAVLGCSASSLLLPRKYYIYS